jgi:superfamily I DNA/RNA helicase
VQVYQLQQNLRNARQVFETFNPLYRGLEMQSAGPDGGVVDFIRIDAASMAAVSEALDKLLDRLIVREGLKPQHIAILSGVSMRHSVLNFGQHIPEGVVCESVMRFKGLEKPVVIVIEIDPWFDEALRPQYGDMFAKIAEPETTARTLLYVGLSRAKTHLFVIGGKRVLQQLQKR